MHVLKMCTNSNKQVLYNAEGVNASQSHITTGLELDSPSKHPTKLTVKCCAGGAEGSNASQFYITTGLELDSLDGKHTIFGEVSEGLSVLQQINDAFVDDAGRPLQNIR